METRLRLTVVEGGLPRPVAQHRVYDERGRFVGRLDLAYPEWKIGIEYDGDHHRDPAAFRRDLVRLNALRVAGWTILRFTSSDVYRNPERIVAQIRAVLPR
jgi:very-short-patch-repair endonuclease